MGCASNTCIDQNPTWKTEFLTDDSSDTFAKQHFASRPDIVETYLNLSVPILKADLLRYLLLFPEGGVWSDLDVSCEEVTPIESWIPSQYKANTSLVVGWEFDVGWPGNSVPQFATWAVMSKPGSPYMMKHADLNLKITGDVVDLIGPRRMTSSIFKSLGLSLDKKVEIEDIWKLEVPRLVGDVLILPGYAFARSSNHYEESSMRAGTLVTHHFAGSWKNEYGGE
ncbi:related to alpha-1,6-mannosyltransferase [Phialocephala subalpina]|uniref:Related to alpha-1,6-mannosyltransferase n=1 Tax=Phialocephala subalpina TaxID=576137 RepID=A0A1L7XQR8_9HELO|nr:related to alpha-1,6-mannosyltransferase [Phialocephala subalpina]